MKAIFEPFRPYVYIPLLNYSLRRLCADEFTVKKIVCREFNKVQFSYSFSLWYSREKKLKAVVRRLPIKVLFSNSFSILYIENN